MRYLTLGRAPEAATPLSTGWLAPRDGPPSSRVATTATVGAVRPYLVLLLLLSLKLLMEPLEKSGSKPMGPMIPLMVAERVLESLVNE